MAGMAMGVVTEVCHGDDDNGDDDNGDDDGGGGIGGGDNNGDTNKPFIKTKQTGNQISEKAAPGPKFC